MASFGTEFEFLSGTPPASRGEVLLVPLVTRPPPALELVSRADARCRNAVSELLEVKAVGDEAGQLGHTTRDGAFRRVVVVGLGEAAKLNVNQVRTAAAAAARWLAAAKITHASLWLDGLAVSGVARAAAEFAGAMCVAGYKFAEYTDSKAPAKVRVRLLAREAALAARALPEIREARTTAAAVNYARRVAHQPPNVLNPATLAREAAALARRAKLKCTLFDAARLRKMGMNGILRVGAGAGTPPCLIQLEYRGAPKAGTRIVLVGKAVTFDTGGYSIKPAEGLEGLKFDKCGGAAVLGVLKAAADLKLRCNLVGLIAAAENAISDRAYRPGDILKMYSGKTVEITNTDAEGRLILADALWYAQEAFKPTHLIDLATLTGGVRVALGTACAGLMSTDDALAGELEECGRRTHERLWRLPLWDDYKTLIKSNEADIKNSAGKRDAHPIVGGVFLKEFIQDGTSWAHLDIAAVATSDDNGGQSAKGATGFGVRLLVDFLGRRAN